MSWLDHLAKHWVKQADGEDETANAGPPNLRAAVPLGPSCDKCAFYNLGMATCRKYGVRTHPQQVCDDFEEPDTDMSTKLGVFPPQSPSGSATLAQPALKPVAPMPLADGSRAQPNHLPTAHPAQPKLQSNRQPSVVAQITQDPQMANIMRMFSPPPQQKTGTMILTDLFLDRLAAHKPLVSITPQGTPKNAALHVSGEPFPSDWNKKLSEPTKENGGVRSNGLEAFDSLDKYRRHVDLGINYRNAWKPAKRGT